MDWQASENNFGGTIMDEKDKKIKELEYEVNRLKKVEQDYKKLKKEFEEFKAKHTGTVQNLRKALKINPDVQKSHNPIGAKPRHTGHGRTSPIRVDREESLVSDVCPVTKSSRERLLIHAHVLLQQFTS